MFCEYLVKDITCKFKHKFNYLSKNYCTRHYNIIQKSLNEKNINKDDELILELKNILTKYKILYDSIEYLDKDTFNIIYLISFQNNKYILKYQNLLNNKNLLYYEYILLSQVFNNNNNIVKLDSINKKNYIYIKDSYSILLQEYLIENLQRKKERYNFTLNEILDISIQLINVIKYIHSNKYLYIDLKPQNIMFIDNNTNNIKLIDFNLCNKYINVYSEFYPNIKLSNRNGNDLFSSRNINKGFSGQRTDDIESILYIILYLLDDNLFTDLYNEKNIQNIILLKESIFLIKLYKYDFIKLLIIEINNLLLIEHKKPNYNRLLEILNQAKQ